MCATYHTIIKYFGKLTRIVTLVPIWHRQLSFVRIIQLSNILANWHVSSHLCQFDISNQVFSAPCSIIIRYLFHVSSTIEFYPHHAAINNQSITVKTTFSDILSMPASNNLYKITFGEYKSRSYIFAWFQDMHTVSELVAVGAAHGARGI